MGRRMRFTPPLQGGGISQLAFPGRRCACPGLLSPRPGRNAPIGRQTGAPSKIEIMVVGRCKRGRGRPRDSRSGDRRYRGAIFIPGCEPKDHAVLRDERSPLAGRTTEAASLNCRFCSCDCPALWHGGRMAVNLSWYSWRQFFQVEFLVISP